MSGISSPKCPRCQNFFHLQGEGRSNSFNIRLPGLLDCAHGICSQCIRKEQQRSQKTICCTICNSDSPAIFRLNYFVFGHLCYKKKFGDFSLPKQFLRLEEDSVTRVGLDNHLNTAENCFDCLYPNVSLECSICGFLCAYCSKKRHSSLLDNSDHKITSVEDKFHANFIICEKHGNESDHFCEDCQILVCSECVVDTHSTPGHKITKFENYINENPNATEEAAPKSDLILKSIEKSITEVKITLKVKKDESSRVASKINADFNYYHAILELQQERMLKNLDVEAMQIEEKSNAKLKKLSVMYSAVSKSSNDGKLFLNEIDEAPIVNEELKLLQNIDNLDRCTELEKDIDVNNSRFSLNSSFLEPFSSIDSLPNSLPEIPNEILAPNNYANGNQFSKNVTAGNCVNWLLSHHSKTSVEKNLSVNISISSEQSSMNDGVNFKPTNFYSVKVIHIISPHEFFVVKESNLLALEMLLTRLEDLSCVDSNAQSNQDVEIDQLYLLNDDHFGWARCRVVNVNRKELKDDLESHENTLSSCECYLMDFGATKTVEISKLCKADESCFSIPPFAIKCSLYQIMPVDMGKNWPIEAINQMKSFVLDKTAGMTVYDRDGEILIVDLGDFRNNFNEPYMPYSVRDCLIFLEYAYFSLPLDCRFEKNTFLPLPNIPIRAERIVQVVHCSSPSDFYIILNDYSEILGEMVDELNSLSLETKEPLSGPLIGMPCLAMYDNYWYRAEILNLKKGKLITVGFVDFGNETTLTYKNVRRMNERYLALPKMAIKCCLADVKPSGEQWTEQAIEYFVKKANEKVFMLRVENYSNNTLHVSLCTAENMCLNVSLVNKGHGVSTGPSSLVPSHQQALEDIYITNNYTEANHTSDDSCDEKFQSVTVVRADDPSCIYFRSADLEQQYYYFLKELKFELENGKCVESGVQNDWQKNDKYAYLNGESWLRAEIKELNEDKATVYNVDEGATISSVNRSSLYILPKPLCDISPFVKRCHLDGIVPAGGNSWSSFALAKLSELVQKKMYLRNLGEEIEGSTPIDLFTKKCTVAGPVEPTITNFTSFSQSLIDGGFALPIRESQTIVAMVKPIVWEH